MRQIADGNNNSYFYLYFFGADFSCSFDINTLRTCVLCDSHSQYSMLYAQCSMLNAHWIDYQRNSHCTIHNNNHTINGYKCAQNA